MSFKAGDRVKHNLYGEQMIVHRVKQYVDSEGKVEEETFILRYKIPNTGIYKNLECVAEEITLIDGGSKAKEA